jgi:hypothetical protein
MPLEFRAILGPCLVTAIIPTIRIQPTRSFSVKSMNSDGTSQISSGARMRQARSGRSPQVYFTHSITPKLLSLGSNSMSCRKSLTTLGTPLKTEASSSRATIIKTSLRNVVANSGPSIPSAIAIILVGPFGITTVSHSQCFNVFGRTVRAIIRGIRSARPES